VLLTRRAPHLPTHKNEISFPGGGRDEGEKPLDTALREAEEEVGISPKDVDVLGRLDEIITTTGFCITPFVGVIPYPYEFTVSEDEIAELILIPLDTLADPENYRCENSWIHEGRPYPVSYFDANGHIVWGATAKIFMQFLDIRLLAEWEETDKPA